jgi:hypothetical protein
VLPKICGYYLSALIITLGAKVRIETILKIYNTLILPTFVMWVRKLGSDSFTDKKN